MKKIAVFDSPADRAQLKASVHYFDNGLPRQRHFVANDEKQLYEQVFLFELENTGISIRMLCYRGNVVNWKPIYTGLHYCFGKGRITFQQFCDEFLSEPEMIAS